MRRRASLVDEYLHRGVLADHRPGCACVIEMDVREQQLPDIGEPDAPAPERRAQRFDRRRGTRIDQRDAARPLQHRCGDDLRLSEKVQIDVVEARGERLDHWARPAAEGAAAATARNTIHGAVRDT